MKSITAYLYLKKRLFREKGIHLKFFGICVDKWAHHIPPCVSIHDNMELAANMTWFDFYKAVRNGGKWDYKQINSIYAEFGNYNYGATGITVGFSESILLRMAGYAQKQARTSSAEWGYPLGSAPYGDDPEDQYWISLGVEYAQNSH